MLYFLACSSPPESSLYLDKRSNPLVLAQQAVLSLPSQTPTLDIVKGLVILSFSPTWGDARSFRVVDPFHASLLAMDMVRQMGLDDVVKEIRSARLPEEEVLRGDASREKLCLVRPC
jgi:hypothetical protein